MLKACKSPTLAGWHWAEPRIRVSRLIHSSRFQRSIADHLLEASGFAYALFRGKTRRRKRLCTTIFTAAGSEGCAGIPVAAAVVAAAGIPGRTPVQPAGCNPVVAVVPAAGRN